MSYAQSGADPAAWAAGGAPMVEGQATLSRDLTSMLRTLNQRPTPMNTAFFSQDNVDALQAELARSVRSQTGLSIGRQDDAAMLTIMRAIYMREGAFAPADVRAEVARLDRLVLTEAVPITASGAIQHIAYLRQKFGPVELLPPSVNTSTKGTLNAIAPFPG